MRVALHLLQQGRQLARPREDAAGALPLAGPQARADLLVELALELADHRELLLEVGDRLADLEARQPHERPLARSVQGAIDEDADIVLRRVLEHRLSGSVAVVAHGCGARFQQVDRQLQHAEAVVVPPGRASRFEHASQ